MAEQSNKDLKPSTSSGPRPRPPVVVVMGHVDHGKTSLLDYIRKANVAGREAGGITQAVGAYEITHNDRKVTFIDTPGHEAFTAMRSRGAQIADMAVLVIAADDGVKPQTKEAVDILKSSKTPFVVAINKIDKTGGSMERAKQDLAGIEVFLEGFGGDVSYHGVSAKEGTGVNELLDLIILAADMEGLTYDPKALASGYVLEARQDKQRGIGATLILRDGILRKGSEIFTFSAKGKIKILENFLGKQMDELEPSSPAIVIGFEELPHVGEKFSIAGPPKNEAVVAAKEGKRAEKKGKVVNLIIKASDAGSLEALSAVIRALEKKDKPLNVFEESVGDITDGDVKSAVATGASIIGFKNKVDKAAKNLAEGQGIGIITSPIIYELVKTVEQFLEQAGKPLSAGELEVLALFNQKKLFEQLVGGKITSGVFRGRGVLDIVRGEEIVGSGKILSLHEKKNTINEAKAGTEAGVIVDSKTKIEVGDKLIIRK